MIILRYLPDLLFAALLVWFVVDFVVRFARSRGSLWDRLLGVGRESATKLWAKVVGLVSVALGLLANSAELLNLPQADDLMQKYLSPDVVAIAGLVIAAITIWARNRTTPR